MIAKLFAILTSRDTQAAIIERVRGNPRTTRVAALLVAMTGSAAALYESGYVIAAGLVAGAASLVAIVALLLGVDSKPPPEPPQ